MRRLLATALFLAAACGKAPARPGKGGWTVGVAAPEARYLGAAAVARGRIHYLGGVALVDPGNPSSAQRTSERVDVFDPLTGTWSDGPSLPAAAPRHHLAVAVQDDRIYVLGGYVGVAATGGAVAIDGCYVLDGGAWRAIARAPVARQGATAQAIGGRIYVAGGGTDETAAMADLWIYDPAADTWTAGPPMPTPRSHLASCAVDGRMVVGGGFQGDVLVDSLDVVESYDPASGTWRALGHLPTARGALGAAPLSGGCAFVGGFHWSGQARTSDAMEWIGPTGTALSLAPLPEARHGMGAVALGGRVWAVGGAPTPFAGYSTLVQIFTP